jgi:hypothetical protein
MADDQGPRPKRQGNYYIPERLKAIEPELAQRYAAGESLRSLAQAFGVSKVGVRSAIQRQGLAVRDKADAGTIRRTVKPSDSDCLSVSEAVYAEWIKMPGREKDQKRGLTKNREFRTACAREYRRREYAAYRELDARRKRSVNRMPKWANKKKIRAFYEMASDLGLSVDHIIPVQGKNICGLHVENNLQLVSQRNNCRKSNRCDWASDPFVGPPEGADEGAEIRFRVLTGASECAW